PLYEKEGELQQSAVAGQTGNGVGESSFRVIWHRTIAVDGYHAAHPAALVGNAGAHGEAPTERGLALYAQEPLVAHEVGRHRHIDLRGAVAAGIRFHCRYGVASTVVLPDPR